MTIFFSLIGGAALAQGIYYQNIFTAIIGALIVGFLLGDAVCDVQKKEQDD